MLVTVFTPNLKLFEKIKAISVSLPGVKGYMQILNDHIPVLTALKEGEITLETKKSGKILIPVTNGYAQFSKNEMMIVIQHLSITDEQIENIQSTAEKEKDTDSGEIEGISVEEFRKSEQSERSSYH